MKSVLALSVVVLSAWLAPAAQAGYPVQPSDGRTINALTASFLVYYEASEISAEVDVADSPTAGYGGSLGFGPGYIGSCQPRTPFGEANKFSCALRFEREGTYYWQFRFQKYECETIYGYRSCSYRTVYGPVWRFDLKLSAAPVPTALPVMRGPSSRSRQDPLYTKIATEIAGKSAPVFCWNAADWNSLHVRRREERGEGLSWVLGYVPRGSTQINLAPEVCNRLDLLAYKRSRPRGNARVDFAEAVDTLAHESMHAFGVTDEANTECYSLQLMDWTAMKLGTNFAYARDMSTLAWRIIYPRIPPEYQTEDCYDGGPLDLFPKSDVWP